MNKDYEYESMLKGDLYIAENIAKENKSMNGKVIAQKINKTSIDDEEKIKDLEVELFGETPDDFYVTPPLYVDYGRHVNIGENFYANMDPLIRNEQLEYGAPINIKDNVWIGGNVTVLPGITIGKNAVVAAGSVVTKDVPEDSIVGGNPAKHIRDIDSKDYEKWNELKYKYKESKQ